MTKFLYLFYIHSLDLLPEFYLFHQIILTIYSNYKYFSIIHCNKTKL